MILICFQKDLSVETTLEHLHWIDSQETHSTSLVIHSMYLPDVWPGLQPNSECRRALLSSLRFFFLISFENELLLFALLAPHQLSALTQINIVCLTCFKNNQYSRLQTSFSVRASKTGSCTVPGSTLFSPHHSHFSLASTEKLCFLWFWNLSSALVKLRLKLVCICCPHSSWWLAKHPGRMLTVRGGRAEYAGANWGVENIHGDNLKNYSSFYLNPWTHMFINVWMLIHMHVHTHTYTQYSVQT